MPLSPGSEFAGYRIDRILGSGGMGAVYAARHPRLPRQVALKVLSESLGGEPEFRARFEREAELAARLDHPNVVSVFDRGVEGGRLWIAMQLIEGVDADYLVKHRFDALSPSRAIFIISEAAKGLDSAHRHGMLHRDIKPANILVAEDPDEGDKVYVADFGIARALDQTDSLTGTNATPTTLPYASPEQIEGRNLDQRSDIYSLTCTLYALLTGSVPFPRASQLAVMNAHLTEPPPRATALIPALPAAMDAVIARGMAKEPADRYPSCRSLAAAAVAAFSGVENPADTAPPVWGGRIETTESTVGSGTTDATVIPGRKSAEPNQSVAPSFLQRYSRWLIVAAGLVVVLVVVGAALSQRGDDRNGSAVPASAISIPPASSPWGAFEYVASAFPGLIPASPSLSAYQGAACAPVDRVGMESNDLETPVPIARIRCGPAIPAVGEFNYILICNRDRSPASFSRELSGLADLKEEAWSRGSSSGTVAYGTNQILNSGALFVGFKDAARAFCTILVGAGQGSIGQQLYDGWFGNAPL